MAALVVAVIGAPALVVGRWLQADNVEQAKVERLLRAQAEGDGAAMAAELHGCTGTCRRAVDRLAFELRRDGVLEIVRYDSATSHALRSERGPTRVVWQIRGRTLPTVQCVDVRRTGSALAGPRVTLLGLSAPIGRERSC